MGLFRPVLYFLLEMSDVESLTRGWTLLPFGIESQYRYGSQYNDTIFMEHSFFFFCERYIVSVPEALLIFIVTGQVI